MISSISDLRQAISQHVADAKGGVGKRWNPTIVTGIWNKLLHDRRMPKRRMTQKRGGASYELTGAPLDYALTPGSAFTTNPAVAVYDRFPIDPTVNPQVVSDLDVFFSSALTRGCGIENSSLQVPNDMGSNQVGGKRRNRRTYRNHHGGNATLVATPRFLDTIENGTGDLATTLGFHPYLNSSIPSTPHSLTHQWQGKLDTIPASRDPTDHTWSYATDVRPEVQSVQNITTALGPTAALFQPIGTQAGGSKSRNSRSSRKQRTNKNRKAKTHRRRRMSRSNRKH